jgi:hypothetical protein
MSYVPQGVAARASPPAARPPRGLTRYAILAGLGAALGVGVGCWYFGRTVDGQAQADSSPEKHVALHHRLLQALAYVVPEGAEAGGYGVLVEQRDRLIVTVARLLGEKAAAHVFFAPAGATDAAYPISAQAGTIATVVFRDSARGLVLLRLERLPAGAASLPLGKWAPASMLHSVHSRQPPVASPEARTVSYSEGRIERILMPPHY